MSFNLQKFITSKIKNVQELFKPKKLPIVLFLLCVLLLLYFIYTTYLKEGFELKPEELETEIRSGKKLVLFYADWCGHCKNLKPVWDETSQEANKKEKKMLKINCGDNSEESKEIMKKYDINGYPTILVFNNGVPTQYEGERSEESFLQALK